MSAAIHRRGYQQKGLAEQVVAELKAGGHDGRAFWNGKCWVVSCSVTMNTLLKYEGRAMDNWKNVGADGQPKPLAQVLKEDGIL